jgi:hypothetical protein
MIRPMLSAAMALTLLCLLSCGSLEPASEDSVRADPGSQRQSRRGNLETPAQGRVAAKRAFALSSTAPAAAATPMPAPQRMVIRTAELGLAIPAHEAWLRSVNELTAELGGYLVDASTRQADERVKRGELTLRVPQESFELALQRIKAAATVVEFERVHGQDVTEEYFDLEARLGNQQRTEERLRQILTQAKSVEDILAVERELSRVREQVERLTGRRKFLADRVSLATIGVEWHEPYPIIGDREGTGLVGHISDGFERGFSGLAVALEGLIAHVLASLPVLGFLLMIIWAAVRLMRWRRARQVL